MFETINHFVFSVAELFLLWNYMNAFKDSKIKMNLKYVLMILLLSVACTAITSFGNKRIDLVAIIVSCIIVGRSIPSIIKYKVGMVSSYLAIGMLIQFEIWSLYAAFPTFPLFAKDADLMIQKLLFLAGEAVTILIMALVYGNQKLSLKDLSEGILVALDSFSFFSVAVCTLVWSIAKKLDLKEGYYACLLVVITSIANFYILLYLIMTISEAFRDKLLKERTIMVLKEREKFIDEVNEKCEYISKLKHNLKHRVMGMCHALEAGDKDAVIKDLKEIDIEVAAIDNDIYTKNVNVNSILRYEIGKAKRSGIKVDYKVDLPANFDLEKGHLSILIGNALDNAIEACMKIEEEKRFINFSCWIMNSILVIKVENSKSVTEDANLKTTKNDKREHGYGLRSIRDISKEYEGDCKFEDKGDYFLTLCRLNVAKYVA